MDGNANKLPKEMSVKDFLLNTLTNQNIDKQKDMAFQYMLKSIEVEKDCKACHHDYDYSASVAERTYDFP